MFVLAEHLDGLFSLLKHYRTVAISLEVKCSACEISRDGLVGGISWLGWGMSWLDWGGVVARLGQFVMYGKTGRRNKRKKEN